VCVLKSWSLLGRPSARSDLAWGFLLLPGLAALVYQVIWIKQPILDDI
jgi:hypothetical protein